MCKRRGPAAASIGAVKMRLIALGVLLVTAACTTFSPPPALTETPRTTVFVGAPFDAAWAALMAHAETSYFTIEGTDIAEDAASGVMTLSFGGEEPERFVDCGLADSLGWSRPTLDYFRFRGDAILNGRLDVTVTGMTQASSRLQFAGRYTLDVTTASGAATFDFATEGVDRNRLDQYQLFIACVPTHAAERDALVGVLAELKK